MILIIFERFLLDINANNYNDLYYFQKMNYKFFAVALVLVLLFGLIKSGPVVTSATSVTNPICGGTGILSFESTNLSGGTSATIDFDFATTYFDSNGDSAPLFVKKGDGASVGYKFISYSDNKFTTIQNAQCVDTATGQFVALLNKLLVIKIGTAYQLCIFNSSAPTTSISVKVLSAPSGSSALTGITKFIPYFVQTDNKLYVAINDGIDSAIYSYDTNAVSPISAIITGTKYNGKVLSSVHGTAGVVYSSADNAFTPVGTWSPLDTTNLIDVNSIVSSYRLRGGYTVVSTLNQAKNSGNIYTITGTTIGKIAYTDSTTSPFMDVSDDLTNYVRVGTTSLLWHHQQLDPTLFWTSTIPISQLNQGANGDIQSVGLSGDKATIVYANKVIYLQILGDNNVSRVYQTTSASLSFSTDYQYKLVLSCMCNNIKRFICYSSTLNCMIVKKGSSQCSKEDPFAGTVITG